MLFERHNLSSRSWIITIVLTISVVMIAAHRMTAFSGARYATADNIDWGVLSFKELHAQSPIGIGIQTALKEGRVYNIIVGTIDAIVSGLKSQLLYDLLNIGSFTVSITLVAIVIGRLTSQWFSILFLILFLSFLPQLWHHTSPAAFPVWPWIPIILFALAVLLYERYLRFGGLLNWISAAFLYFFSFFSKELFLLTFSTCAVIVSCLLNKKYKPSRTIWRNSLAASFFTPMLYALIYFSFKHYSGGYYPGAQLGHPSLLELLRTIWQFSIGGFIFHYIGHGSYPIFYRDSFDFSKISLIPPFSMVDVFQNTTLVDYTMALTSGVIAAIAARKCSASFSPKGLILTVLAGSLVSVSALVLYSLTDQFPYLVEIGHVAYQPTRYAYFGWCIVLSAAAVAAIRAIGANRTPQFIALAFLAIGTALGSLSASYFNERVAATMRVQTAKWDAVDMAMQCAPFLETADGDDVYAPRLNSVVWWAYIRDKDQYWNTYISNKFHEKQRIFMTVAATPGERVHFLDYRISMSGRVLGVFLAEVAADGKTNVLHVLSKRTDALLILFQEAERQKIAIASWGMHSKSCGEYMVNRIIGNAIDVNLVSMYLPPQIPLNNPINFPD